MCKSDGYEPYMTLDTPIEDSDPDVVLWEPSAVANESTEGLWKSFSPAPESGGPEEPGMSSSGLWEPPPVANTTNELLWESSTLHNPANITSWGSADADGSKGAWEPRSDPSDPIVSNEWLWKPPSVADVADTNGDGVWEPSTAANPGSEEDWKPSYVVNDSSDGTWKRATEIDECEDWKPTYAVNESTQGLWKPSTVPSESIEAFWEASFTSNSINGGFLQPTTSYVANGSSEWTPASGSSTIDEGLWNSLVRPDEEIAKCADCPQEFPCQSLLRHHRLRFHNGTTKYDCSQCKGVFSSQEDLELHFASQHASKKTLDPSKKFSCNVCLSSFTTPFSLRRHFDQFHDKDKPFKPKVADQHCTECQRSFTTLFSLNRHYDLMHGITVPKRGASKPEVRFPCPECPKGFSTPYSLKRHFAVHGKGDYEAIYGELKPGKTPQTIYTCDVCWKDFTQADKFNAHVQAHSGVLPFPCSLCSSQYASLSQLNRHNTRVHSKRFGCPLCPSKFGFVNELSRHMETSHTKLEHAVACSLCERTFAHYAYLNKHYRRVHQMTDPYHCVGCGRDFPTMAKLEDHLSTTCVFDAGPDETTDRFSFGCQTCGMRFGDTKTLGNHRLGHVKVEGKLDASRLSLKCPTCGLVFEKKRLMLSHLATHSIEEGKEGIEEGTLFCTDCDESFSSEPQLVQHCRTHHLDEDEQLEDASENKSFLCRVCLHKFDQHCELLQHLNRHLGR